MNEYDINDMRKENEFLGITFSKFKMSDVKKELIKDVLGNDIEGALYWSGELICSGHFKELWEIILSVIGKNIHLGNIKLPIYIQMKIGLFKEILLNGYIDNEIKMRNNVKIRELFSEIITILTLSNKKNSLERVKINKKEFDITNFGGRLKADHINYAKNIFLKEDPKELLIAINEFCYSIDSKVCNMLNACYWIEWILEFEHICKLKKERCKCERRVFAPVDSKLQMELIWIIWDIFITESNNHSKFIQKVVLCSLNLFSLKYTIGCNRKRKQILYFIVGLLTQPILLDEEIIKDKNKITLIIQSINKIYKQIKKGEHSPGTDYLYTNVNGSNLEKTIAKLEQMNSLGEEYIPRI